MEERSYLCLIWYSRDYLPEIVISQIVSPPVQRLHDFVVDASVRQIQRAGLLGE